MSNDQVTSGTCLCAEITVSINSRPDNLGACHCSFCRTWSGGPLMTIDLPASNVTISKSDHIKVFDSSDWAERGFCSNCGTHLFYRLKQNQHYYLPVGLFKGIEDIKFDHQVFIDEKPNFYNFAEQTKNMTGAEVFAMFGGNE